MNSSNLSNAQELIDFLSKSQKKTPVEILIKGNLENINFSNVDFYGNDHFGTIIGNWDTCQQVLKENSDKIQNFHIKNNARNSAVPLLDIKNINARIEPGSIIRETAKIGDNAVIMMGAVINLGAEIGSKTMIDMNVTIGGRAIIGENCHIGAGSVIAGVIEPPSADPVIIGNDVVAGANVVVLEGIKVGNNAVLAAGSVVTKNVPENAVVAGVPAKVIKIKDEKTSSKTEIVDALRNL